MDPENKFLLKQFGKQLMLEVRDDACKFMQSVISGKMRDETSKTYFQEYKTLDKNSARVLHHFLTAAIDACLVRFLNFFSTHEIPLYFKTDSGQLVDVQKFSDGLVGELYNEDGWIALFCKFGDHVEPIKRCNG